MTETVGAIVGAVFTSGALFTFIQYLIDRHDGKSKQLKEMNAEIKEIKAGQNELRAENKHQNAMVARGTIIAFDDELTFENKQYSRERFMQILEACEVYESWSKENPDVQNGYGKMAVKHIREVYDDLLKKGTWKL